MPAQTTKMIGAKKVIAKTENDQVDKGDSCGNKNFKTESWKCHRCKTINIDETHICRSCGAYVN